MFVFFGGLLVLALSAALIGPYFIDWTSYRADFEREAGRVLGREVKVAGDASARLLPFPSVSFTDVRVASTDGAPAMTVEEFSMDAELAPFLRGEILIFDMRLIRPTARIRVEADGTVDWAVRPDTPFDASQIALEKLTIEEGRVEIAHAASGRTHLVTEINTEVSARSLTGPWRMNGSARLDGMLTTLAVSTGSLAEDGSIRLRIRAEPERYRFAMETDGSVKIGDDGMHYGGGFQLAARTPETLPLRDGDGAAAAARPETATRVDGRFDLDQSGLDIAEFRLETGAVADPYTAEGTARVDFGAEPRFVVEATGAQMRFDERLDVEGAGGASLATRMEALRIALLDMPRPTIPGRLDVRLPAIVAGDTTIRDVTLLAEPGAGGWAVSKAAALLPGRTSVEADGFLAVTEKDFGFEGNLLVAVGQPSGFAAWLARDVDEAIRRLPAAGFSAKVSLSRERQVFQGLELILGGARFNGSLDRQSPGDGRPAMLGRLEGGALDIDGLAAFASLFVSDSGQTRFADHDLEIDLKAGPVSVAGLTAESVDTAMRLKADRLDVDRLAIGGLEGASISATASVTDFSSDPVGNADASILAGDLSPLVRLIAERFPQNAFAAALRKRADAYPALFADAQIDVVASAVRKGDASTEVALSAQGHTGSTAISATITADGLDGSLARSHISASASAQSEDAAELFALTGLPALDLGFIGKGQAAFSLAGTPADGAGVSYSLETDEAKANFTGTLTALDAGLGGHGEFELTAEDLEPWLLVTGSAAPGLGMGLPATLKADAGWNGETLTVDGLSGTLAGMPVEGDLTARLNEGAPHLEGRMALGALDLGLVAEALMGSAALQPEADGWPRTPFAPSARLPATADLTLKVAKLSAGTLMAENATLALRLDDEGLRLGDLQAGLFGGKVSGLVELRNNAGTALLSAQIRLDEANLATAFPDAGLSGQAGLSVTASASGKSVDGLVAALSGSGAVSLREARIDGLDANAFDDLIAAADAVGREIDASRTDAFAPEIVRSGSFAVAEADFPFTLAGGVIRTPPISVDSAHSQLSGSLTADLSILDISAEGELRYDAGAEALVGSSPSVGVSLVGFPSTPVALVDTGPLAQFLTQRALEIEQARVEAMQAELLEKQRIRREVRYYASLHDTRERLAEEERVRAEEEARLKAEEEARQEAERIERLRLEAEEKARSEEEARKAAEAAEQEARRAAKEAEKARQEEARQKADEAARAAQAAEEERKREAAVAESAARALEAAEAERRRAEAERSPPSQMQDAAPRREPGRADPADGAFDAPSIDSFLKSLQ